MMFILQCPVIMSMNSRDPDQAVWLCRLIWVYMNSISGDTDLAWRHFQNSSEWLAFEINLFALLQLRC